MMASFDGESVVIMVQPYHVPSLAADGAVKGGGFLVIFGTRPAAIVKNGRFAVNFDFAPLAAYDKIQTDICKEGDDMLRIGLCDDNADARLLLQDALERTLEINGWEAQFFQFSSGEGLLDWYHKHIGELDLVFLDIEMKALSGIDTARQLHTIDDSLQLVFCTSYSDYVFDGYGVGALGYLLKPPTQAQLQDVLQLAQTALLRALDRAYVCHSGDITYRVPYASILYFASERRKVHCVTKERTLSFYGKLDEVAAEAGKDFVRVHQRYLVHMAAIARLELNEVVLTNGERLPVSRSCRQAALLAMARSELEG